MPLSISPASASRSIAAAVLALSLAAGPSTQPTPASTQPATRVVQPRDGGPVFLHAKDASVHGGTIRFEPQPQKNTIGYWINQEDWVSWNFTVTEAGRFDLVILQGCGTGSGGAEVEFAVGNRIVRTKVQDTGSFQNFIARSIGTIELPAGDHTLSVKPLSKPGKAVMDLRAVTLKPSARP